MIKKYLLFLLLSPIYIPLTTFVFLTYEKYQKAWDNKWMWPILAPLYPMYFLINIFLDLTYEKWEGLTTNG